MPILKKREHMLSEDKLPKEYILAMKELLGEEYEDYINTLNKEYFSGLRVNTLKISNKELLSLLNMDLRKIEWEENGYYIEKDSRLSKSPYYFAGLYYMQEPSAMSPASLLEVKEGDRVLDLCAAPGGKSTKLACALNNTGLLVSNDISNSRAKALLKNIELFGIKNALITCEEPEKLARVYEEYFDKILVDAPCSGEGMFRKDIAVFNAYLKRGSAFFSPIQYSILKAAAKMLKKGGELLYSTCTYSKLEDEDIIIKFLEENDDFEIVDLKEYNGFTKSKYIEGAIRLYPHKLDGEGHFVCKLRKRGNIIQNSETKKSSVKLPKSVLEFLNNSNIKYKNENFFINGDYVYYLPDDVLIDKSLRYLRTGLLIGRMNNKRFEPSQAYAMSLKKEEWKNVLDLDIEDIRVIKYLKGETIEVDTVGKDYILVCLSGYPLGFAKQDGNRLKNKYYKGWRMN